MMPNPEEESTAYDRALAGFEQQRRDVQDRLLGRISHKSAIEPSRPVLRDLWIDF